MAWLNDIDNRKFAASVGFVLIAIGLVFFLHYTNTEGQYSELIVGIIGMFAGVAGIAGSNLTEGKKDGELAQLKERMQSLELRLAECHSEREVYVAMFNSINEKLVEQSGILNNLKKNKQDGLFD